MTTKPPRPPRSTAQPPRPAAATPARPAAERWAFSIYVTDDAPRSRNALQNLTDLCEAHVPGRYAIEVVDLLVTPERARADGIVAIPTVVRTAPDPRRTVIGDLADVRRAAAGLELSA